MLENKNFGVRNGISVQKMFFLLNNAFLAIKTGFGVKNKTDNGPKFYSQTDKGYYARSKQDCFHP
jgi:hypothetical protein